MIRRLGNKSKLLHKIIPLFPDDISLFIDPFFGSGSVSFAMIGKVNKIIANDLDSDVFNVFQVTKNQKEELIDAITIFPIHEDLFKYWKTNQEDDPVWKAVRFLFLSNFGYMGQPDTLRFSVDSKPKVQILKKIDNFQKKIQNIEFMNCDFRKVFEKISYNDERYKNKTFIYCDPPYLGTDNNYSNGLKLEDSEDLFQVLMDLGIRFAVSEFDNPTILDLAKKHKLNVNIIGERRALTGKRTEILITNYETEKQMGF